MHGRAPLSVHVCAFVSTLRFHQGERIQYFFSFTQQYCQPIFKDRPGEGGGVVKGSWSTCLKKE